MKRHLYPIFCVVALALSLRIVTGPGSAQENTAATGNGLSVPQFEDFDPANFDAERSYIINNEWLPMPVGTQFIYEGTALENDEVVERRVIFTVTDLTKMLNGVRALVIWDRDFNNGELLEAELTFFAQSRDGAIWHLGQHRETYDEIEFVGGRTWIDGYLEGAHAGIMMWPEPWTTTRAYSHGYAPPPFNWTDQARVYETGQETCIVIGCYDDVLVIEEFDQEAPEASQLKYYARGVGVVRVGYLGDDPEQETMELVAVVDLDAEALAEARAEALALETRAYTYGLTPAAESISGDA